MATLDDNFPMHFPALTETEKLNLRSYYSFYELHWIDFSNWVEKELSDHPTWGPILASMPAETLEQQRIASHEAQIEAVYNDNWEPYLKQLGYFGISYARVGMDFHSWFEVVNLLRRYLTPFLLQEKDSSSVITILNGMDRFMDIAMSNIGDAYLYEHKRIIEQQKHEQQLLNKELENFVYIASHDLQEPLNTVTSFTTLLVEEYGPELEPDAMEYLSFIKASSIRMTELITGLLDYSRVSRAKNFKPQSIDVLVKEVLEDMRGRIAKTNAQVKILEQLPELPVAALSIKMLFQNLISNALKFQEVGAKPIVTISAKEEGAHWHFVVEDNGIGIDEKYTEKIFEIFRRLHHATDYEGSGIGLAHCKKIVEVHGGHIWVASTPGVGSKFHFTILKQQIIHEEA
jgi:signal transduction histidine kinase